MRSAAPLDPDRLDLVDDPCLVLDETLTIRQTNRCAFEQWGGQIIGQSLLALLPSKEHADLRDLLSERNGPDRRVCGFIPGLKGLEGRFLELEGQWQDQPEGSAVLVLCLRAVNREGLRAPGRPLPQANLLEAGQTLCAVVRRADNPRAAAAEMLRILGRASGASRCCWFGSRDGGALLGEWMAEPLKTLREEPGFAAFLSGSTYRQWLESLEPGRVAGGSLEPDDGDYGLFHRNSIRAYCLYPLHVHGRLTGWIALFRESPTAFQPDEGRLLATAGDLFALLLEKSEIEDSLILHRQFLSASPDQMAALDLDFRYIFANTAYRAAVGYEQAQIAGRDVTAIFNDTDFQDKILPKLRHVVADRTPVTYKAWFSLPAMGQRFMSRTYFPLMDTDGVPTAIGVIGRDLTELEIHRSQVRQNERDLTRLLTAVDQIPLGVMITNPKGTVEYVNGALARMSGYDPSEIVGRRPSLLKSGRHDEAFYADLWKTVTSNRIWQGRIINRRKDGDLYTEDAVIAPVRDPQGEINGYIAIKEDITRRLALEEEVRQAQKLEAVRTLAGGLAHDFNDILAALQGYIGLLSQKRATRPEPRDILRKMERAIERAAGVTRQVLSISRPHQAQVERVLLNEIVMDTVSMIEQTSDRRIAFHQDLDRDLPPVQGDPGQMSQMILNVLLNAVQAMPRGGEVAVRTRRIPPHTVRLEIRDSGPGMDSDTVSRIFDPFFTTKPSGEGTGLGLTMVHRIVESHKGRIQVRTEPGRGTCFVIEFPADGHATSGIETADGPPLSPGFQRDDKAANLKILVVDDEAMVREILQEGLSTLNHRVLEAGNGREALAAIEDGAAVFDLVILDMNMPGWDGLETLKHIRSRSPDIPAILATGYTDDTRLEAFKAEGRVAIIQKPFKLEEMDSAIRALVARYGRGHDRRDA